MIKQSFYITFRLPRRRHEDEAEKAIDRLEARYAAAENRRQEVFSNSMYEQQQQYADEEMAQWDGERQRASEFEEMMVGCGAIFDIKEQRRVRSFLDGESRQEEIFKKSEKLREILFSEGQSSRAISFQHDQDTRDKRTDWYKSVWESCFRDGRQARKDACEELEKALMDQFNELLSAQEEFFASDESRRDATVKELIEEESLAQSRLLQLKRATRDVGAEQAPISPFPIPEHLTGSSAGFPVPLTEYDKNTSSGGIPFPIASSNGPRIVILQSDYQEESARPSQSSSRGRSRTPSTHRHPQPRPTTMYITDDIETSIPPAYPVMIPIIPEVAPAPQVVMPAPPVMVPYYSRSRPRSPPLIYRSPSYRPRSESRSPRLSPVPIPPSPVIVMQMPSAHNGDDGSFLASASPKHNSSRTRTNFTAENSEKTNVTGETTPLVGNMFDERFRSAQENRQHAFSFEEESREQQFQQAEAARDKAEVARGTSLNDKEHVRERKTQIMMAEHEQEFAGREAERNTRAAGRDNKFEAEQTRQSQIFEQALLSARNQFTAADGLEAESAMPMRNSVKKLDRKQRKLLEKARERLQSQFDQQQRNRERLLETRYPMLPSSPGYPPTSPRYRPPSPRFPRYSMYALPPRVQMPMILSRASRSYSPRRSRSRSRSRRYSRRISMSPTAGFAASALLRGENPHAPLPIPSNQGQYQRREMTAHDIERRRQHLFHKAQELREAAFENGIRRRRQIFTVSERRRQLNFETKQRERKAESVKKEDSREIDFRTAQNARERRFLEGEVERDLKFRTGESLRDATFASVQKQNEEKFHSEMEGLRKQCFEAEARRLAGLEQWAADLLEERERAEKSKWRAEQREREEVFQRSLRLSELKARMQRLGSVAISAEE
ncbi:hypothetical protein Hypma_010996 [Hypsizygus marmoreus]|uniref:Uncharacterized protein n=1 Tax=Hypsizygus marmoreus TaxID=39966 RepID=A0A369JI69_HYPMA|nr:hypothetical protein Hypma_010996 [Hypsizygus marmoreus]